MDLPQDMAGQCFGHRSRKAARAVTRAFNQRLKPFGLNISQYVLLGVIARGEHRSVAAMAEEVGVEPSALLRNLRLLEDRGLIAGEGGRGRAGRRLAVTEAGVALIWESVPAWRQAQTDLAALLDGRADETREALVRLERAALALEKAER
jgi:DNA-binding MarR family transcriptional regulator